MEMIEAGLSPIGFLSILFASGVLIGALRRQSRIGPRLVWSGAVLYLVFLLTPLAELLYASLERPYPPMLHADKSVRNVVVLSAFGENTATLPVTSQLTGEAIQRMVEGIRLYREIPGARLILSGGIVNGTDRPVADLMAEFAGAMGVPGPDIVVEGSSTSTYENLAEVKKIIGSEPFILVTSSGHLRRAMAVARKLDMTALAAPAAVWSLSNHYPAGMTGSELGWRLILDLFPTMDRFTYLEMAFHEYLAYFWYWMLGRV
jgi:uncharacterized SAM-binding protein YcdF (DUF218 family)